MQKRDAAACIFAILQRERAAMRFGDLTRENKSDA